MRRHFYWVGLSVFVIALIFASAVQHASAQTQKTLHLAFVTNNASDFWTIARAGTLQAEKEVPNIQVDFRMPQDGQAATQKRNVQDLLSRGVDGIAISPIDPANQKQFLNDVASQSLLICQDSDAPDSNRACYVGTDNVAAGRQAGELIKKALPQGGKIMVFVGKADAQNARERYNGIKEALAGSNVTIIDLRTDDTDRVRAKNNVKDTILKYPDIACLVGLWSYNGPAIYNAVKEAGQTGKIKIVCFDEEDETLAGVKDGTIYATVVQQPYEFGRQAIMLMAKYIRGDKSVFPAEKKVIVPTLGIDKGSVDEFATKLKTLRGK
ncbi:MAG TPA: sugar-binding protein [Tepidisphaeraceae bacterium]|nr:sugar-binding protein [Tepidisphaeraceae bacterium]